MFSTYVKLWRNEKFSIIWKIFGEINLVRTLILWISCSKRIKLFHHKIFREINLQLLGFLVVDFTEFLFKNHSVEITEISLTLSWQKIREINGFTKEVTKELIWRNIFSVRENFSFFHTEKFVKSSDLFSNELHCKLFSRNLFQESLKSLDFSHCEKYSLERT